jgi:hypothetical protein
MQNDESFVLTCGICGGIIFYSIVFVTSQSSFYLCHTGNYFVRLMWCCDFKLPVIYREHGQPTDSSTDCEAMQLTATIMGKLMLVKSASSLYL